MYSETIHHPQRITKLPNGIEVSSVHYDVILEGRTHRLNETCVFYPSGDSEVVGTYDDHDKVVASVTRMG